jgi:VanZ family protein
MRTIEENRPHRRFLPFLCGAIFIALLLAGLWPFDFFPKNNVQWLPDQEVLRFGRYGIARSSKPIEVPGATLDFRKPVQFEFKVRPGDEPGNSISRILSICGDDSRELFFAGQWKNDFILRLSAGDDSPSGAYRETGMDNLLRKNRSVNLSVRMDESGLSVFADGEFVKYQAGYSLSRFSGLRRRVVFLLGNSPAGDSPWEGDFHGFSIRQDLALQREHVSPDRRVADPWTRVGGNGTVVTGLDPSGKTPGMVFRIGSEPGFDMFIPATFRPLKRTMLFPPWKETRFNRSFMWDVAVNVIGFIPFGFCFYALLWTTREGKNGSTAFRIVLLSAGISLAIELLQAYLPSRDSSLTDVVSNTLGSYVGVSLFRMRRKSRRGESDAS